MEQTGRERIIKDSWEKVRRRCANCGASGKYRVTFEDMYSKLTVTLCEECEKLGYGQLKLQSQIEWPASP